MKSWKTTVAGILAALSLLIGEASKAFDDDPRTQPSVELILTGIAALGIGVFARDNNVSSEKAGAK